MIKTLGLGALVSLLAGSNNKALGWLKSRVLNSSFIRYGVVGCVGIAVNLATLALLFAVSSGRGWVQSALANVASTVVNFILHNLWTFSDRQHQGSRIVRGFLSFVLMSAVGICIATVAYVKLAGIAAHVSVTNSHTGKVGVLLLCQFVAILLGASVSYTLNRQFTWPATRETAPANTTQVQEI